MKQSRITARLISVAAAVFFAGAVSAPVSAESDSWITPIESQTEATEPEPQPEEPEETEPEAPAPPEETAPPAVLDPDFTTNEPEDPEDNEPETPEEVPAAALDQDDLPATEPPATEPPATEPPAALPAATYTPEGETTMYAPQVINIRSGPGTDYDKLGVLYANSEITVIGSSGEWAAVSYNGSTGYILRSLLSSTPPTTTAAAPETAPPPSEDAPPAPEETLPPETLPTEPEWQTPELAEPIETTEPPVIMPVETTTREPAPAASVQPTDGGGLSPFLIAFLSAAAAFLLIGVLPVFIHRVHHKNLYRY